MPIAYSYKRVSSKKQVKGHGPERQQDAAEEYAALHGLTLDDSYHDLGMSGYRGKNAEEGALGAFLDEVRDGRIPQGSYLLVENLDRLSRDKVRKAMPIFLQIINAGIKIVTLLDNPPQVYSAEKIDEDNGMSLFGSMMVMVRAHEESKSKGKRVKQAWDRKRESGKPMTTICPKWLRLSEDRTHYVVIPDKASVVQRMFKMSIEGVGIHSIAKTFNEEKVLPLGDARNWEAATVARILHNRAVTGVLVSPRTGEVSEDYYPKIIEQAVFDRVQLAMKTRNTQGAGRKGETVANLFSGMFRCHICGSRMRYTSKGNNGYVHCLASYESAKSCTAPRLNYAPIEDSILANIFAVECAPIVEGTNTVDPMGAYRVELGDLQAKMERYFNEFENASDVMKRHVQLRMEKLAAQIESVEEKIKAHIPAPPVAEAYARAKAIYNEHEDLRLQLTNGKDVKNQFRDARLRLQATLQNVIERIDLHPHIEKMFIGGTAAYKRQYIIYGKLVELAETSESLFSFVTKTEDNGLVFTYFLPTWGLNNTGREAEYRRQFEREELADRLDDLAEAEAAVMAELAEVRSELIAELRKIPESERTDEEREIIAEHEMLVATAGASLDVAMEHLLRLEAGANSDSEEH